MGTADLRRKRGNAICDRPATRLFRTGGTKRAQVRTVTGQRSFRRDWIRLETRLHDEPMQCPFRHAASRHATFPASQGRNSVTYFPVYGGSSEAEVQLLRGRGSPKPWRRGDGRGERVAADAPFPFKIIPLQWGAHASGRAIEKRAPVTCPSPSLRFSAQIRPRCASTIWREIDRPRPELRPKLVPLGREV